MNTNPYDNRNNQGSVPPQYPQGYAPGYGGYNPPPYFQQQPRPFYGHINMPPNPYAEQLRLDTIRRTAEKKDIRRLSNIAGGCVLVYLILQELLAAAISFSKTLYGMYMGSGLIRSCVGILISVVGILFVFLAGGLIEKKKENSDIIRLNAPNRVSTMLLLIPVGMFVCLIANYITMVFTSFMSGAGVELMGGETDAPGDKFGRLVYFIQVAIVPPLCEEVALRGVVMQPLRKYGDRFAILASAMVFGLMHGNLVQAPFAFIVGIFLGYSACVTNSLWTPIIIHFCNNAFSALMSMLEANETTQTVVWYASIIVIAAAGIACAVYLGVRRSKALAISGRISKLTSGAKAAAYIFTVPMVLAILALLFMTAKTIRLTGSF